MQWLLIIVGGIVLYALIQALATSPGRSLQNKFVNMGILVGKTKSEIVMTAGSPSSTSVAAEGAYLLQWMASGYHIALLFKDDICVGITHEFSSSK